MALYRDLSADRSTAEVARQLGKAKQLIDRWSSRYQWVQRCRLFDAFEDDKQRMENMRQRQSMMRRISAQAMLMQIALAAFKKLGTNPNLTPGEATHLADIGARLEMRSRGEPGEGDVAPMFINISKREPEPFVRGLSAPRRNLSDKER